MNDGVAMVEITDTFFAEDRETWRGWLLENHTSRKEIWLILYKKHTKEKCVSYEEAVEEAVCFGWIDGIMKRIDDRKHTIRFSPRRKGSVWSEANLKRAERMMDQGKMMSSGLEIYEQRDPQKSPPSAPYRGKEIPAPGFIEKKLMEDPEVWEIFKSLPPSHKNMYIGWISTAKKEETKLRRIKKAMEMLRKGGGINAL